MNATASSTHDRPLGVLVGFDGSEHAQHALAYAAAEAGRRGMALTVATASVVPTMFYATLGSLAVPADAEIAKNSAEGVLDEARRLLHEYRGPVEYLAEVGDAAGALVELSRRAQLAVVGTRGRGGFTGRVLGSVSVALASHAHCPAIVVSERLNSDGPITVAIEGSHVNDRVLHEAAAIASMRGTSLDIVTALPPFEELTFWYPDAALDVDLVGVRQGQIEEDLRGQAETLRTTFPGLEVTAVVEVGSPQTILAGRTRSSQLTVLGTRGRGAVASVLLGSVSRSVLFHAEGPVMIVPSE
ncbi:universal stress protein UspA [Microbacterium nanhaiense]|uniref:Universal stress protein UspA n=1 Tax=Microbacterium nanhaiense TaxID=1301026 RepID=A0ABQ2MXZ4_9MICO|nr:universal stress protein [Microbacterium nanhaiense]GGO59519.1 universal stress protein UspA [Microbacterium nanhaiense]